MEADAAEELVQSEKYFESEEWKRAQKRLSEVSDASDSYFRSEEWKRAQMELSELGSYFESEELEERAAETAKTSTT